MTTKSEAIARLSDIMNNDGIADKHRNLAGAIICVIWDSDTDYVQYLPMIDMLSDQVERVK